MLKKAVIFSLDAIFSAVTASMLILSILFFISQSNVTFDDRDRYAIALDSLAVLEIDGTLHGATQTGDPSTMQQYLDALPGQVCSRLSLYTSAQVAFSTSTKTGCTSSNETSVAKRAFIVDFVPYYAQMEVWYE